MNESEANSKGPLILRIFLSPAEGRACRAGWRLLLHTLAFVFLSLILFLMFFGLVDPLTGGLETSLWVEQVLSVWAILIATWLARRLLDRRSFRSLGLELSGKSWADLAVGFVIPGLLMGLIFLAELSLGWTTFERFAWQTAEPNDVILGLVSGLVTFTLVGFSEEILSRGYHLQNLKDGLNLGWALFLSSAIFAVLHAANPGSNWVSTLGLLLAGYFLAYGWVRTRQLWLPIGLHIGWNFFEGVVFGFPVSGLSTFRLIQHNTTGPVLFTGGEFGPEAGLIIIPAMALGIVLMRLYTAKTHGTP